MEGIIETTIILLFLLGMCGWVFVMLKYIKCKNYTTKLQEPDLSSYSYPEREGIRKFLKDIKGDK